MDFSSEIKADYCLYDDIGMDSISVVDVIVKIENEFDISFSNNEVKEIKMVQYLLDAFDQKSIN